MRRTIRRWAAAALVWGATSASGAEVSWLKLTPSFHYRDLSTICSTDLFSARTLYFGTETTGTDVVRAVIRNGFGVLTVEVAFLPEELAGIELRQDADGRIWLKTLPLGPRILNWLHFNTSGPVGECRPPQPLATIGPVPFAFAFAAEDSTYGKFAGRRKDGGAYQSGLSFRQAQYSR